MAAVQRAGDGAVATRRGGFTLRRGHRERRPDLAGPDVLEAAGQARHGAGKVSGNLRCCAGRS